MRHRGGRFLATTACVSALASAMSRESARSSRWWFSRRRGTSSVAERLAELEKRVADLERVAPGEFSVVLAADQYASNLQPWFLYGDPPICNDERAALTAKFLPSFLPSSHQRHARHWCWAALVVV